MQKRTTKHGQERLHSAEHNRAQRLQLPVKSHLEEASKCSRKDGPQSKADRLRIARENHKKKWDYLKEINGWNANPNNNL